MNPIFTMDYSEYEVSNILKEKFKGYSIFIPASRQEEGIDLILYNKNAIKNKIVTIQVKSSRSYTDKKKRKNQVFKYHLWLNTFKVKENADLYFLTGLYPNIPENYNDINCSAIKWDWVILVLTHEEMKVFIENVKCKKSDKPDKMFGFSFNDKNSIHLTRGCKEPKPMSEFLLENRINMIKEMF